ncbi:MAG: GAF domain-containing protein [Deltaproteobacteria bacterium]|nr:GAF domain-containing protein [Deltaproteobacteria bacterium]
MDFKKKRFDLSLASQGLHYRLSIIFALFFFMPLLGLLYFGLKYHLLEDRLVPIFIVAVLASSLAGYVLIRRTFDAIRNASQKISDTIAQDLTGVTCPSVADELQGIVQSFHAVESELRSSFKNLEKKTSQLSTLKELSDLCYVTFDSDDLFAITLERALKLTNADIGSVLILEGTEREAFSVHATYGLGDRLRKGDRVDFATSIAKFTVINKSPLIIDDVEQDTRFGRGNRAHYATKAFLSMPLKGIHDVFGVLTLSRRSSDVPFTQEDADILTPFLSNAAFTYDNLSLIKRDRENRRQLATITDINRTLGSSLRNSELLHAVLSHIQETVAFDIAVILSIPPQTPDHCSVLDVLSALPFGLSLNSAHPFTGSILEGVVNQGNLLAIDRPESFRHPLEQELFVKPGLHSALLVPLKIGGAVTGVLLLGAVQPGALSGQEEKMGWIASLLSLALEKNRLSSSVTKRDLEMESIKQIGGILAASTFDRKEVLKHTLDMIQTIMDVEAGALLLLEGDELLFKVSFNSNPAIDIELLKGIRIRLGQGISGYAAARGETVLIRDTRRSQQFLRDFDERTGFSTRSVLCVPLVSRGRVLGVIEVLNKISSDFNDDDVHLLQSIATSVSIALENSQLYQETISMAEQERGIRSMFQKFVPREIVDKIIHDAELEKPLLEELKILTLLNIDIRGFSALSQKIGPQRTVAMLNRFFTVMGAIVFKHGGIVDKYLGDGFLAIFGAPIASAKDADNAAAAALEMQATLASLNERFQEDLETPLAMGISIHTGEAVVGNIGFEKKMDYTVIGDSVNAVFRLQELTKPLPNSILVSEKMRLAAMNSQLEVREIGMGDAGSALGEMKIYELLGRKPKNGKDI